MNSLLMTIKRLVMQEAWSTPTKLRKTSLHFSISQKTRKQEKGQARLYTYAKFGVVVLFLASIYVLFSLNGHTFMRYSFEYKSAVNMPMPNSSSHNQEIISELQSIRMHNIKRNIGGIQTTEKSNPRQINMLETPKSVLLSSQTSISNPSLDKTKLVKRKQIVRWESELSL